jgi:hypothetical protein
MRPRTNTPAGDISLARSSAGAGMRVSVEVFCCKSLVQFGIDARLRHTQVAPNCGQFLILELVMSTYNTWAAGRGRPFSALQTFFMKLAGIVIAINVCVVFSTSYVERKIERTLGSDHLNAIFDNLTSRATGIENVPEARRAEIIAKLRKLNSAYRPYIEALTSDVK